MGGENQEKGAGVKNSQQRGAGGAEQSRKQKYEWRQKDI
jgi:hypothetical protein